MWRDWHKRLKAHKEAMDKAPADADLAAELSADPRVRKRPVGRALVNHWFNGIREPELSQFFVLCELLKADPAEILQINRSKPIPQGSHPGVRKHSTLQSENRGRFNKQSLRRGDKKVA